MRAIITSLLGYCIISLYYSGFSKETEPIGPLSYRYMDIDIDRYRYIAIYLESIYLSIEEIILILRNSLTQF